MAATELLHKRWTDDHTAIAVYQNLEDKYVEVVIEKEPRIWPEDDDCKRRLSYNPNCPVCRFSAKYALFLARLKGERLSLYAWAEGTQPPWWMYDLYDIDGEHVEYLPYFQDGLRQDVWAGTEAIIELHRTYFGGVGIAWARFIAIPIVKLAMKVREHL